MLRKHQIEMMGVCKEILAGKPINTVIASVTPGGGKSLLPVILTEMLITKVADKLLWVVPRNSLKYQGEGDFINDIVPTKHRLRAANGNEHDITRGYSGYITTYQAIGQNPEIHAIETAKQRYIVFLDEPHHVSEDSSWEKALKLIIENSILTIYASGTLSRGDGQKIAFLDYAGHHVDLGDKDRIRIIKYSRTDALSENSIVPVKFHTLDGSAEWSEKGVVKKTEKLSTTYEDKGKALFTALSTEYAYQLLNTCIHHWKESRKTFPGRLLIVAPNIEIAKEYHSYLGQQNIPSLIATSEDSPSARKAIESTRKGVVAVLVTVAMAYEGLSIKQITHIACLTHIRSVPWLEQCFARANRTCEGKTSGFVFGPKDTRFLEAIWTIENEQLLALKDKDEREKEEGPEEKGSGSGGNKGWEPLKSSVLGHISEEVTGPDLPEYTHDDIPPSVQETILRTQIRRLRSVVLNRTRAGNSLSTARVFDRTARKAGGGRKLSLMDLDELYRAWRAVDERFGGKL